MKNPSDPQNGAPKAAAQTDTDNEHVREEITEQMTDRDDAADIAVAAVDELAEQAAEVERLRGELEQSQEKLLRQAAEFQNYRRRTDQEKSFLVEYGKGQVVQQLLDVVDDLERSLDSAQQAEEGRQQSPAYAALKQGVELVYRKFMDELKRLEVTPIEAVGQPFDPELHEAMMQQPAPDGTAPDVVLGELQRGYRMGERVLRHSKVIVSS